MSQADGRSWDLSDPVARHAIARRTTSATGVEFTQDKSGFDAYALRIVCSSSAPEKITIGPRETRLVRERTGGHRGHPRKETRDRGA